MGEISAISWKMFNMKHGYPYSSKHSQQLYHTTLYCQTTLKRESIAQFLWIFHNIKFKCFQCHVQFDGTGSVVDVSYKNAAKCVRRSQVGHRCNSSTQPRGSSPLAYPPSHKDCWLLRNVCSILYRRILLKPRLEIIIKSISK